MAWNSKRKSEKKGIRAVLIMALVFLVWAGFSALGAESSIVEKVAIKFSSTYGDPEEIFEPEITISGKGYSIGDIQFKTDFDKWEPGKKVRMEINLIADDGKFFPSSLNRSECKVTGADFVSAKALDNTSLQVKVDYRPVSVLGTTTRAGWSNGGTKAVWKKVEYAPGYSLVLYGDNKAVKRMTVNVNYADLSEFMKDIDKTYYYEVKAIPVTSDQKKYLKEGAFVTSEDLEYEEGDTWQDESSGERVGDGGALRGNHYILPDGTSARNSWKKVSGKWYYFDNSGNMAKGWMNLSGLWYYADQNGVMVTGWVDSGGGLWSFMNESGVMMTGWVQPTPGSWYYMNAQGYMERGWVQINGLWYYLGTDGKMITGWAEIGGNRYYFYNDGSMAVNTYIDGWQIDGEGKALRQSG
ncbi:N-acetylmuramoyl-L-alanine amidase family protein [Lachnospiraceae bacterium 62-35]